ncbi:purine nucleoside permease [Mycena albidolilacea]|uniref:Purine nucleoside permease n=1 Tax=Mycena albidolilacea TaxID=1033008 RepID=A0AAD7AHX4_9AGAR|nr:purine nucleoside permease [Mycena albidolilacea]
MTASRLVTLLSCLLFGVSCTFAAIITPKVFIITMFDLETNQWFGIPEFNLLAQNITVPGFSPLYQDAHCTKDGAICLLTTGQAEINAASTISALLYSRSFNLTSTYFLIAGIAGVNPKEATISSVTFARYAVQVGLQYEIDAREIPPQFPTGYFPQGSTAPGQQPGFWDGTEVFEVNDNLRQLAFGYAKAATLNDTAAAKAARAKYTGPAFVKGAAPPGVVLCDTATSDEFWSGNLLGEAFENTTKVFTKNAGTYCTTQQEDNATLQALMRGALFHLVDFSRIIIMRSASDFDRPFPGQTAVANLLGDTPGFNPAALNLRLAGVKVVQGIVSEWDSKYARGVKASNYIGDVFGSLGGQPDFGPGSIFGGKPARA